MDSSYVHRSITLQTPATPGLPVDFIIGLLARLWSGGTFAVCDHPPGNNIEFHGLCPLPTPWIYLGTRSGLLGIDQRNHILMTVALPNRQPLIVNRDFIICVVSFVRVSFSETGYVIFSFT